MFKKALLLTCGLILALATIPALAASENITQLVFTTPPRTVAPATLSDVLTIQTQGAGGAAEQLDETADLTFLSSSATGEFLNSAGNPASTVMSRGSANRSFYYRDQTAGAPTLNASERSAAVTGFATPATRRKIVSQALWFRLAPLTQLLAAIWAVTA